MSLLVGQCHFVTFPRAVQSGPASGRSGAANSTNLTGTFQTLSAGGSLPNGCVRFNANTPLSSCCEEREADLLRQVDC